MPTKINLSLVLTLHENFRPFTDCTQATIMYTLDNEIKAFTLSHSMLAVFNSK